MKRIPILLAFVVMLSAPLMAAGPLGFGLHATGATLRAPDPLGDVYGGGFGGGAHVDLNIIPLINLKFSGDYMTFSPDLGKYGEVAAVLAANAGKVPKGTPASLFNVDGGRFSVLAFSVNGKFGLGLPLISPYATLGGGMATTSITDVHVQYQGQRMGVIPGLQGETKTTANIGIGADLNLIALKLYAEAKYVWIFTSGETTGYIPITVGVTF